MVKVEWGEIVKHRGEVFYSLSYDGKSSIVIHPYQLNQIYPNANVVVTKKKKVTFCFEKECVVFQSETGFKLRDLIHRIKDYVYKTHFDNHLYDKEMGSIDMLVYDVKSAKVRIVITPYLKDT